MTTIAPDRLSGLSPAPVRPTDIVGLSVQQYQQMIEQGIIPEDSSIELLRGVMVRKDRGVLGEDSMVHSPLHATIVRVLTILGSRVNSERYLLQVQLPVECPPDSVPEPDAAIVRGQPWDYEQRLPGAADVSCVIEVAHSSLQRDRQDKLPIYAVSGIGQYVLINLQNSTIEVYEDPDPQGEQYRTRRTLQRGESLSLRLPDGSGLAVPVADVLP